jgi:hypothetical protein
MNPSSHVRRLRLQAAGLSLLFAVALLSGCSGNDAIVDSAVKRYGQVRTGMSKHEAVTLLGEPSLRQKGLYRWETAGRPPNLAAIEIKFNADERIASIARSRAKD